MSPLLDPRAFAYDAVGNRTTGGMWSAQAISLCRWATSCMSTRQRESHQKDGHQRPVSPHNSSGPVYLDAERPMGQGRGDCAWRKFQRGFESNHAGVQVFNMRLLFGDRGVELLHLVVQTVVLAKASHAFGESYRHPFLCGSCASMRVPTPHEGCRWRFSFSRMNGGDPGAPEAGYVPLGPRRAKALNGEIGGRRFLASRRFGSNGWGLEP